MGHLLICLNQIIKLQWELGLKALLHSNTSKVIFLSIDDPRNFIEIIRMINADFKKFEQKGPNYQAFI